MLITVDARTLSLLAWATALACVAPPASDSTSDATQDTGSSESESATEGEGEAGSEGFTPGSDFPPTCDPIGQDCPEGEKCVAYAGSGGALDSNKCVPVTGDQSAGEPCQYEGFEDGTDDCDALSACWGWTVVDGEWSGVCRPFCSGTADTPICPPGHACTISGEDSIAHCEPLCHPLAQDCEPGWTCIWSATAFNCTPTIGDIPEGEPCGFINDCAEGSFCADAASLPSCAGGACCASFCDLDLGPGECAIVGTECVSFFEVGRAPDGYENVGVWVLPP